MEAVVQWVRISWTKRSRGEPGATRRNAAPTAFPLPPRQPAFVHQVLMSEYDDSRPHASVHEGLPDTSSDSGLLLREDNCFLRVQLTVTPYGMPRRWRLDTLNIAHGPAPTNLFLGTPNNHINKLATLR